MLKKILIALAAIVVLFLVVVALQPAEFQVVRSTTIAAPPAEVFSLVNDFHAWQTWSPWAKLDPHAQQTYEGPAEGTGAIFKWSGNKEVGEGMMTLIESHPSDLIRIKLDFVRPFAGTSTTEFTFQPEAAGTLVTWKMSGQNNFIGKAFHLFINMDKMLGGDFEKGLAQMKAVAEAAPDREPKKQ